MAPLCPATGTRRVPERGYLALGTYMAGSAVVEARAPVFITRTRDTVRMPSRLRPLIAPIKALTSAGLLSVGRSAVVARLSATVLTVLFAAAVGAHLRVGDRSAAMWAAAVNAAVFAVAALAGPGSPARHRRDESAG